MYHHYITLLNMRTASLFRMKCLLIHTFGNSRHSGRIWYLCEFPMIDLYLSMKLIEVSSNDILSYCKEEVNFCHTRTCIQLIDLTK